MSEEKKTIVRNLGFGGLMHIPPLRVHHQILRELANSFKLGENRLKTGYDSFKKVNYKDLSEDDKQIFRRFQGKTLKNLTDEMMAIIVDNEQDRLMFKRIFILYIQMAFLLPTTINKISPMHLAPIFKMDTITERNWGAHVLNFIIKGITDYNLKKKKAIDGCLFALMIIYFHLTQSKKKKIVVEDSSPEQAQSYYGYNTLSKIGTEDLDEFLRKNNEKSTAEGKKEADLRSTEGHYVSFEINPVPEDAAALMMMAWTASYVPKADSLSSFSLGLTNSSQEEAPTHEGVSTQEGGREKTLETPKLLEQLGDLVHKIASDGVTTKEKSPQIPMESGAENFEKFETPARTNELTFDMKEKCYLWAIRVKRYANGLTNEFDTVCTLQAQGKYILSKVHLASLAVEMHIEAENMAIVNHPKGVFLNAKTNRPFRVEDYPMFIPFLDLKKVASHRYGYVISRIRVYVGGPPLKTRDKDKKIEPPYLNISGQKTSYDCAIYVMKWLEIIQPENIKRLKYEWDNWTQDEVDHFRVEYAFRILFHEMNQNKAEAIRGSYAIRLSKASSLLLSPYYQIDSNDI
ncbi:hypothetical protein Ahy_A01g002103 [Arachis hypogaea]|uniref:Ubiquitin-like protease family profile domain-containing protein n=1 Tax=Arachis hypogaea TaxID=3818 RepID=A0A445EQ97_ARAHY|nr:hypothetical protein Ahy_A01g002103 [Arachis hypogaea]